MAVPRRLSRLDPSPDGRMRCNDVRDLAQHTDARDFFRTQRLDSRLIDPGRLIESVFLGPSPSDDAEVVLIAWLAVLPKGTDVPAAAADLAQHFAGQFPEPHSALQRRLLDLLAYVATHCRVRGPIPLSAQQRKAKP